MSNIRYKTKAISAYFSSNRNKWDDFYPSEKWVLEKIADGNKGFGDVLDIGCACGGLGVALSERFGLNSYTGIDIDKDAIGWAKKNIKLPVPTTLIAEDILKAKLEKKEYDNVFSLSCADWNIETDKIIEAAWKKVKKGGYFIISLRLSDKKGINDIKKSYQYINYTGKEKNPAIANYVVFNIKEAFKYFSLLCPAPEIIGAYGYWGKPSSTAVTPYSKLMFAVLYVKKGKNDSKFKVQAELNMPLDVLFKK